MDTDHFTFFTPRHKRLAKSFRLGNVPNSSTHGESLLPGILVGRQEIEESKAPESLLEERWSVLEIDSLP